MAGHEIVPYSTDAQAVSGVDTASAVTPASLTARLNADLVGKWDDVLMPVTAINPSGPDGTMTVDTTEIFGSLVASVVGTPSCCALFQLNHQYQVGTALSLHVHYVKNDGADNAGTVPFEAKWIVIPIGATVTTTYSNYAAGTIMVDPGDTKLKHGIQSWVIPATGLDISSIIAVVIRRNGGTSGQANLLGADVHYQKGQQGSTNESSL